jgi:outer membrane protein
LNLSLLLFSAGRAEASVDAATARFYAAGQELRQTRQEVVFEVTRSYYNVLRLKAIVSADEEAVRQMEHYLNVAKEKNEIGKAPKLDVLRAEVQLADVTQSKLLAVNQLEIAQLQLLNAMGVQDDGVQVNPVPDSSQPPHYIKHDQFLQEALDTNPDYLRAKYLTQAAERGVGAARAEFGPNLNLVGSYNAEGKSMPDITNWNVGLSLSVPIYNGGITRARVGEAKAVVEQSKANAELISRRMTLGIRSAVLSTQDAANRLAATSKSVEQAQEAVIIAQEKYAVGLGSTTEVIDTQVALVQAKTNYVQAIYDGKVANAALDLAVGRDPIVGETGTPGGTGEDG